MKVAVIAGEKEKEQLLAQGVNGEIELVWLQSPATVPANTACCIDLLFTPDEQRIRGLETMNTPLVIINAVTITLAKLPENFIRINGWNSLLAKNSIEASSRSLGLQSKAEEVFTCFNKTINWTPDIPGFVTARIISTIINEAYLALGENVSSKADIDIAMKLGTNYPYGPFEWSEKIGIKNIFELLNSLTKENNRYQPAELLTKEVIAA
jgi:3-hydroxybutyryl-CoA dehydrogenase